MWNSIYDYQINYSTMKKILLLALPLMVMCFASCEKDKGNKDELSGDDIIQFEDAHFLHALLTVQEIDMYDSERDDYIKYLVDVDTNRDSQISVNEAKRVRGLHLTNYETDESFNVLSMPEIKYFTSLEYLSCDENQLVSLDVSGLVALRELYCAENSLTSLNVNGCKSLTVLACEENKLVSLNLNGCSSLKDLECDTNQLSSLDLSSCAALKNIWCDTNPLQSVTISESQKTAEWLNDVKSDYPDIEIIVK